MNRFNQNKKIIKKRQLFKKFQRKKFEIFFICKIKVRNIYITYKIYIINKLIKNNKII
jgi:hypothetical protein